MNHTHCFPYFLYCFSCLNDCNFLSSGLHHCNILLSLPFQFSVLYTFAWEMVAFIELSVSFYCINKQHHFLIVFTWFSTSMLLLFHIFFVMPNCYFLFSMLPSWSFFNFIINPYVCHRIEFFYLLCSFCVPLYFNIWRLCFQQILTRRSFWFTNWHYFLFLFGFSASRLLLFSFSLVAIITCILGFLLDFLSFILIVKFTQSSNWIPVSLCFHTYAFLYFYFWKIFPENHYWNFPLDHCATGFKTDDFSQQKTSAAQTLSDSSLVAKSRSCLLSCPHISNECFQFLVKFCFVDR